MHYEFVVEGSLSSSIHAAFPDLDAVALGAGATRLRGRVRDHSDVLSVLARIGDLGLLVVEMRRLPD